MMEAIAGPEMSEEHKNSLTEKTYCLEDAARLVDKLKGKGYSKAIQDKAKDLYNSLLSELEQSEIEENGDIDKMDEKQARNYMKKTGMLKDNSEE